MTDYSKPIGWWCPDCQEEGQAHKYRGPICNTKPIPVYAVIPEGEREAGETRAEMKSAEVSTNQIGNYGPLKKWHLDGHVLGRWADQNHRGGFDLNDGADVVGEGAEGDAVLWVVEGRLPK